MIYVTQFPMHRISFPIFALITVLFFSSTSSAQTEQRFTIDTEQSAIRIITDKKGIASAAAHRHVVSITNIIGDITYLASGKSVAKLTIKPEEFLVDNPAERARYPEIFDKPVSDKAIRGTIKNMLGKKLLNAAAYPAIEVELTLAELDGSNAIFDTVIHIQNRQVSMRLPGTLNIDQGVLVASASFEAGNRDFGLRIFSAMFGSISVGHKLSFEVNITARQQ